MHPGSSSAIRRGRRPYGLLLSSLLGAGLLLQAGAAAAACPCSLWAPNAVPAHPADTDTNGVEIGVKFTADAAGTISGIRFYKGVGNGGTHVGNLWRGDGTLLATATFSGETASGWQQVSFASPVSVAANTTYIASYFAPQGHYAGDNDYFAQQGVDAAPLHAPAGANGVYAYGPGSSFPSSSWRSSNYWVDVVYSPSPPPPPVAAPIVVITAGGNPFTSYYAEILRAEGLNEFATLDINALTDQAIAGYDVAILGEMALSAPQVTTLTNWVNAGGNLIAMRPDKKLAGLLGLTDAGATLSDRYLKVDTAVAPGTGIAAQTMQFHDTADLYTLNGATSVGTLYSDAFTPTVNPAVTLRTVGAGHAAAFVYDLAKSIVYTRQGNPAWAGQERDGSAPRRPDDLFFPDYVNLDKVAIPQADEQQRLLANLVNQMMLGKKPLPRFWYLPKGLKAAIVHALDDHNTATGTQDTINKLIAASPPGCSVDDWGCARATSWFYLGIPLTDQKAGTYNAQGFEFGVHVQNGCGDFAGFADLDATYVNQLSQFQAAYPSLPPQTTHRYHCIVWSDWVTQAKAERAHGIRFSLDYYYWPGAWVAGRPGVFTGSGFPMRFADLDGSVVDVYQGVSQVVNENGIGYAADIGGVLSKATGPEGYYGMFGTHDDYRDSLFSDAVISASQAYGVPIISAKQALTWLDARNGSTFSAFSWSGQSLDFTITAAPNARNLTAMLPSLNATNALGALTCNGAPVAYTTQTIKGVSYAFFPAATGPCHATYDAPIPPPPSGGATLWAANATPAAPSVNDPHAVELGVKFTADRAGRILGVRFYKGVGNTGTHTGSLWANDGTRLATATFTGETATGWQQVNFAAPVVIQPNTIYIASYHTDTGNYAGDNDYFAVAGVDSAPLHAPSTATPGGNGVYVYGASAFPASSYKGSNYWVDPVFVDLTVTSSLWSNNTAPSVSSAVDPNPIELGVKFQSDVAGSVKGIRFFKGVANTGTHTATLWTAGGAPLATATFSGETASGWQQVLFNTPVPIAANTLYVASYYAPAGNYAVDAGYFGGPWDNAPLHAPASGAVNGNGVYQYGPSGFPTATFNSNNYWVDVLFEHQ